MGRRDDNTPEPPGKRAAERLRMFERAQGLGSLGYPDAVIFNKKRGRNYHEPY